MTMAKTVVRKVHGRHHAAQQDELVTPFELISFARSKALRH
jgi:hypothetical protein